MDERAKYLVHADLVADGVVERNDVVGAVFGQTEGLLGDDLDIRDLQDAAKVGRMDVEVESENGQSYGHLTIPSSLDRVETAIFAASLEAIERIGPCRADVEVQRIEDVRAAKRREIVDRAKQLLATAFDDGVLDSEEIVTEVREAVRAGTVTEFEGLPAGPHVESSEAVLVVEGRADVLTLLRYGIKNAVAVEGTNVPDAVATLTQDRNTTAFLDGDRGGDLIFEELKQTADVDYVARAPPGLSVEDLTHAQVDAALRNKRPVDEAIDAATAMTDGSTEANDTSTQDAGPTSDTPGGQHAPTGAAPDSPADMDDATGATSSTGQDSSGGPTGPIDVGSVPDVGSTTGNEGAAVDAEQGSSAGTPESEASEESATTADAAEADDDAAVSEYLTIAEHAAEVEDSETARLLDEDGAVLETVPADDAFDAIEDATEVPAAVVLDSQITQRLVDVSAQRGVARLVGASEGEYVKQPVGVRVLSFDDF